MEQLAELMTVPSKYEDIVLYDDYGNRVTNSDTLEAIAEAQEFLSEWLKGREKWNVDRQKKVS